MVLFFFCIPCLPLPVSFSDCRLSLDGVNVVGDVDVANVVILVFQTAKVLAHFINIILQH